MSELFTQFYRENHWGSGESASGEGSELRHLDQVIKQLPELLRQVDAGSLLDIPCGDYNWMKKVDLDGVEYIGADIVEEAIKANRQAFNGVDFRVLNLCESPLPKVDVIFVRDCLVHLSNRDIFRALENIAGSGSRYLLTTTFTDHNQNKDINTGFWRPINLERAPFNFPAPKLLLNEGYSKRFGRHADKSLGLWEVTRIARLINADADNKRRQVSDHE